ncbi:tyrosyl-tRNA synthetase [Clostridium acetobutylicum]|uniref:Tyrosine--tRNA ligase 2 n=1 Tax=Clostridium acetobutylicum (strain ATCC 824 / DSM 792 / JCM 1419 / IAM 19013 / LMG 5710 / NBRC 13948 / NRRL B-527 / VKM B-1787 / 2291 / W) TaxID=272562 RepID=SYY2_CLOAB|nr:MULTISPECIES: tyrosine--tRNA ligase [Clostridium]Q97KY6.1 RecName: Full=Tyrosine--tRNA ligase 2; AltName: Full=Tyrosyl-tRNA synthetase 2; Short=TyrRS 2 [Clostridium acetobutylicum ATCC 824]AAK78756.1 Tyrosyl-tRNA synthetase [Clostridium acetobutylicum ATCC 824]ADZ19830.1 tyrosyl-tRNA synthetase [Clostridium acetobutylicum EA 2018]AEI33911.1 tyrosyl-tRNA synthetase [Clostridium acetobutylicum DSM 1731]AWV80474.1 tyrosine--tRNA ligase [Clostridium acetobutylicum]MBC2392665.1 tyrosine--tRNA l
MKNIDEQIKIIKKGAEEIIDAKELKEKLIKAEKENTQLVVKLGLDPSAPDIHLGHAVVLRKLKQLQDLGHKIVIIIGDFTGMIGDPTGKSKTRKQLSSQQVMKNAETYEKQIFKILDRNKTDLRFNSQWLEKLNFKEVIELASKYTVARMLEREDFKKRFKNQQSIGIHEFFYPLMQAYDSMAIKADIEFGGTDQRFNLLMGRTLQAEYGEEKQIAIFMPLLEGIDGKEKMSKSLGNYIGIEESAKDMYVKVMQIPDSLIIKYFELCTDMHPDAIDIIRKQLNEDKVNPRDIKMKLAKEIVCLYHNEAEALNAEIYFKNLFQDKEIPEDIPIFKVRSENNLIEAIVKINSNTSKSEARRLIAQGGVKLNGRKVIDFNDIILKSNDVIQIGKKKIVKLLVE